MRRNQILFLADATKSTAKDEFMIVDEYDKD